MTDLADWTYEGKHTILKASPELKERFRAGVRAKVEEEGATATDEQIEEMAAFAWSVRAEEVCARADVLIEEGVPNEEVRNILSVEPE